MPVGDMVNAPAFVMVGSVAVPALVMLHDVLDSVPETVAAPVMFVVPPAGEMERLPLDEVNVFVYTPVGADATTNVATPTEVIFHDVLDSVPVSAMAPVTAVVLLAGAMVSVPLAVIRDGALTLVVNAAVLLPVNAPVTATVPPVEVSDRLPDAVVTVGVITDVLAVTLPVAVTPALAVNKPLNRPVPVTSSAYPPSVVLPMLTLPLLWMRTRSVGLDAPMTVV